MGINELTYLYPLSILPNPNPPKSPILTPLDLSHLFQIMLDLSNVFLSKMPTNECLHIIKRIKHLHSNSDDLKFFIDCKH